MKQSIRNSKLKTLEKSGNILCDNSSYSDLHFYDTNIQNLNTSYILPEGLQNFLDNDKDENVSILHLNIRSINKTFENFKMFSSNLHFSFSIISFSETRMNDSNVDNSNYELQTMSVYTKWKIIIERVGFQYIFIRISNLKSKIALI